DYSSIYALDGLSGIRKPAYSATTDEAKNIGLGTPTVHTDGTIFTLDYACSYDSCGYSDGTDAAWVVGIDPSTGQAKFKVPTVNPTWKATATDAWCDGT